MIKTRYAYELRKSGQPAGSPPRPDLTAVRGQQAGNEPDQVPGHVEHDTIGDHAEPLPGSGCSSARLLLPGAPRLPGDLRLCPRVCLDVLLRHVCQTRPCWENLNRVRGADDCPYFP